MDFALNTIDVVVIVGSLVVVVVAGLLASRKQDKTARGYFLASGRLPWWIIGSAFVSTSVSSEQIVGTVGAAYKHGMSVANWEWCSFPVYTLLLVFFVPIYLKNRITTVSEFFARRYGPLCSDIYGGVMLVAYVFIFLVPVLYGGSLAFSMITGWPFHLVLWLMVALVAAYAVKGGLVSVMWTDAIQCLLLVGGGVLLFFAALGRIDGGWEAMIQANPDRFHLYRPVDDPLAPFLGLIFASFGVILFYQAGNQVMIQRILAARSTWDGLMGVIFAGFINFIRPLVTCFLGLIVYHWIHVMKQDAPLDTPDKAFPYALRMLTPSWGLRGMILAGFLAAVMSTVSALANSTATLFALDVYKKRIRPDADDARVVRVGRLASLFSLVLAALMAPSVEHFGGIFQYFQTGVTYLSTPFICMLFLGILWKRANYAAGLFGVIGGLGIQIGLALGARFAGLQLHWLYVAFAAQVLTVAGMIVVALITAPPPVAAWQPFLWSPSLLRHYDEGVSRPWYQRVVLWYALFGVAFIYLYWRYW
ncbi:MAG TPA: sodium/solute symporter [Phycisphaerae bacterium]|nr:sodium/solute symporter [Phycisphaerae bacterium]